MTQIVKRNCLLDPKLSILFLVFLISFSSLGTVLAEEPEQPSNQKETKLELAKKKKPKSAEKTENSQTSERKRAEIEASKKNEPEVEAVADDLEYVKEEKKLVGRGNVVVSQKDIRLLADKAEIFTDTKKTYAEGHVTVMRNDMSLSGDKGFYDFTNHQASFPNGRFSHPPFYVNGEQIEQVSKNQINIYQAVITTCPLPHGHYDFKANRATIYPGDKIVAWNVTFRILKFPIFWLPYIVIPLDQETGPIDLGGGQSKNFGNFLLMGKTFSVIPPADGREIKTKFHVDRYTKRGTAIGNESWYHLDKLGDGYLKMYRIKDSHASDPFFFESDEAWHSKERARITWKHRTDFDPNTNFIALVNKYKDPDFFHQFFNPEFSKEPVPQSFFTLTRNVKNYGILVDVQKRVNDFDNVLERLPEVRFNWNSTEVQNTGVYYTNTSRYTNFHSVGHNTITNSEDPRRRAFTDTISHLSEYDTFHEITYPKKIFRYYDITPSGNARWTFWNHNGHGKFYTSRHVLGLGTEGSTRFFRFFEIPKGSFLGIKADRMRHIVKPIITYTSTREVSTRPELVPPLGIGASVSDVIRFGLENRIQTKSGGQRVDIVSFNTYANYEFNNPNNDTRFTTADGELTLRPYPWLQFRLSVPVDLKQHRRTGNTLDMVIKSKYVDIQLNHRYVLTSKESLDSDNFFRRETNIVTLNETIHLNDRWSIGSYMRWELKRHSFREYEGSISRDLHDWVIDVGENIRHSNINWLDHVLFFRIQLKAFPGLDFSSGQRAQFPDARIGESVSGANVAPPPPSLA